MPKRDVIGVRFLLGREQWKAFLTKLERSDYLHASDFFRTKVREFLGEPEEGEDGN